MLVAISQVNLRPNLHVLTQMMTSFPLAAVFAHIVIGDVNPIGSNMLLMTDNAPLRVKGFNSVQTLKTK